MRPVAWTACGRGRLRVAGVDRRRRRSVNVVSLRPRVRGKLLPLRAAPPKVEHDIS